MSLKMCAEGAKFMGPAVLFKGKGATNRGNATTNCGGHRQEQRADTTNMRKDEFAFIKKPIMELPTSIYFNKRFPKSDEYAKQFRIGLNAIIENGRYLQILENYYGKNNIPSEYKPIFHTLGVQYPF